MQSISKAPLASYDVSVIPCNQKRNRFANIYPCKLLHCLFLHLRQFNPFCYRIHSDDFSRVKLKEIEGVEGSDYINASFLDVMTAQFVFKAFLLQGMTTVGLLLRAQHIYYSFIITLGLYTRKRIYCISR